MKKYALLLLLVLGLSTSAWGYCFTSPISSCWIGSSHLVSTQSLYPSLYPGLGPSLSPCIGLMGSRILLAPTLCCRPGWQSFTSDLNYQGVTVYQGHFANQSAACQSSINVQVHRNCVQVCGDPPQGGCQ